ncbi:MAG: large conductance mechanosensitive channel protein MscL [Oscillospiraceae bacterium]|nr:large conductance mechanosensitive channel protein MscL [Oscillospiraceae bacterium]
MGKEGKKLGKRAADTQKELVKSQKNFWKEFKEFITQGNVINLAIGVVIGGAFQAIVRSVIDDVIMPLIAWFTKGVDFSRRYLDLSMMTGLKNPDVPPLTPETAKEAGHVVITYGALLTAVINFFIIALLIFLLVRSMTKVSKKLKKPEAEAEEKEKEPAEKTCPYCKSEVPAAAVKCRYCTSELDLSDVSQEEEA